MQTALWVLGILAALSQGIVFWQWIAARRFPLHKRRDRGEPATRRSITVLKPLKGTDPFTRLCLQSWLAQDGASAVQFLFGVESSSDPACDLVKDLIATFPRMDITLVLCPEKQGINSKVSKLIQMAKLARHDIVVLSDADVKVPPDFLSEFSSCLENPRVGLVNCFYKMSNPSTLAMRVEAVAVNADFWSQVLQSNQLKPMDFALGAAVGIRRQTLKEAGGFEVLADCLADDYQLGNRVAKLGLEVCLSPVVVECLEPPSSWSQVLAHQLRWARTIRVCQPVPYFFSLLNNATLWPLLWMCVARSTTVTAVSALLFLVRSGIAMDLQQRLTQEPHGIRQAWLVALRDLMGAGIWLASFSGSKVTWRGVTYQVDSEGKLKRA